MAEETKGKYYHIRQPARADRHLRAAVHRLARRRHRRGLPATLAKDTGGKYYRAADVKDLPLYFRELADELQSTYTVTFRVAAPATTARLAVSTSASGTMASASATSAAADYQTSAGGGAGDERQRLSASWPCSAACSLVPAGVRRLHRTTDVGFFPECHDPHLQDTIVALSTAPGPGGRAIVRLSGPGRPAPCSNGLFHPGIACPTPAPGRRRDPAARASRHHFPPTSTFWPRRGPTPARTWPSCTRSLARRWSSC